jgi:geranylgeranyl pyrophosphate synthase
MANGYVTEALELLSHVPQSRYRDLLEQFAMFVMARRH